MICGESFNHKCGAFTLHLERDHSISLKDYIVKYELNGMTPKCQCGYCDEDAPFVRGKFLTVIGEHKTYKWAEDHYIEKNGIPKCKTCGKEIGFKRGEPLKYCSPKCFPNQWNQTKCRDTLFENHGTRNPMEVMGAKETVSKKNRDNAVSALEKRKKTVQKRYGVDSVMKLESSKTKQSDTVFMNHGVSHPSQIPKNRDSSSLRMTLYNSTYDPINNYRIRRYEDTDLIYQSSYELDFIRLCERMGIVDRLHNGNGYRYLECDKHIGHRLITDFSIDDYEIEIKSSWIMNKQGGMTVIFAKRDAVLASGKKYIFILDKNYDEFIKIFSP